MDAASETLFALRPVSFRYKKEVDRSRALSFGLIAEEVAEVDPDLITRDKEGQPQTVRYDAVNAMLLNEFLKEHAKVQQLEASVDAVATQIKEQKAKIEKVSAQLQTRRAVSQVAMNNP
jgi:ABC-type hemin transport system substrate-binding protein